MRSAGQESGRAGAGRAGWRVAGRAGRESRNVSIEHSNIRARRGRWYCLVLFAGIALASAGRNEGVHVL